MSLVGQNGEATLIAQGEIWWADFGEPRGSAPGYVRPVVVVQGDNFNQSRIATILCVPLTTNMKWAASPGNLLLKSHQTGLDKDSVANASQLTSLDRSELMERVGKLPSRLVAGIHEGIDIVLGR